MLLKLHSPIADNILCLPNTCNIIITTALLHPQCIETFDYDQTNVIYFTTMQELLWPGIM